jgi:carbon storage regulator CsrA
MLVLTRKLQQQIKIGDNITVTILKVKGSTVRVGIAAPRDVRVVRSELPPEVLELDVVLETAETADAEADAVTAAHEQPLVRAEARDQQAGGSAAGRSRSRFTMPPRKAAAGVPALAK